MLLSTPDSVYVSRGNEPYHWDSSPSVIRREDRLQVEPMPRRDRRDERLARELRARIYAGDPAPGEALDSAPAIAASVGNISQTVVQRAFDELRREGLVRGEHGRGTYVCPRRAYQAVVTAPVAGRLPGTRQLAAAERDEPAVTGLTVADDSGIRIWSMTIEAADIGPAATVAVSVARAVGAQEHLKISVEPA